VGARSVWEDGKKTGYAVNLTINYYRGLPLSCIECIELTVDGEKVAPEAMLVQHNGREYKYLDLLKDDMATDFYWLFGEKLRVVVQKEGGIDQGRHTVALKLGTRRSYTPTMWSECERTLTFA
jgi:hypothetical protein